MYNFFVSVVNPNGFKEFVKSLEETCGVTISSYREEYRQAPSGNTYVKFDIENRRESIQSVKEAIDKNIERFK